jgi:hypothetical protein
LENNGKWAFGWFNALKHFFKKKNLNWNMLERFLNKGMRVYALEN